MMISFDRYTDGREGAPLALVADLSTELALSETEAVHDGDGFAVLRNGRVLDWTAQLPRPRRRRGHVVLADPESFVAHVARYGTTDTLIYASIDDERLIAVYNDHPESNESTDPAAVVAGYRDDRAVMALTQSDDWRRIVEMNNKFIPQQQFAELIEDLAHVVTDPDSATMLEVASTLNVRQNVDFGSGVRTQTGDVEFRFEQTSDASAGRNARVEIPSTIAFTTNPWVGCADVTITARLRFRASPQGCVMGYRLIKLGDTVEKAFRDLVVQVNGEEVAPPVLYGAP